MISNTTISAKYMVTAGVLQFSIPFRIYKTTDVSVFWSADGKSDTNLTLGTDYSVSIGSEGGTVTLVSGKVPVGSILAIEPNFTATQETDLSSTAAISTTALETQLDKQTQLILQMERRTERSVILPATSSESPQDVVATIYASRDAAAASADAATASADAASAQATAAKNSADTAAQTVQTATAQAVADATAQATAAHNSALDAAQSAAEAAAASGGLAGRVDAVEIKNTQQDTQLTEMGVDIASVKTSLLSIAPSKGFANITGATTLTTDAFGKLHICTGTTDYTVTLPAAAASAGKMIAVCISSTMSKLITVKGSGTELIEGSNTRVMWAGESTTLYCDGTVWHKIAGTTIPMMVTRYLGSNQSIPSSTYTLAQCRQNSVAQCPAAALAANDVFTALRPGNVNISVAYDASGWGSSVSLTGNAYKNSAMLVRDNDYTSSAYSRAGGTCTGVPCAVGDTFSLYMWAGAAFTLYGGSLSTSFTVTEVPSW